MAVTSSKYVERIDALTGCANLLAFLETFSIRLASTSEAAFSLLLVDLNNFSVFNAEHGHEKGDAVLHWIGIVLRDTGLPVYRIGGDEFLMLFDRINIEEYNQTAQSIFKRIDEESKQFNWANP